MPKHLIWQDYAFQKAINVQICALKTHYFDKLNIQLDFCFWETKTFLEVKFRRLSNNITILKYYYKLIRFLFIYLINT